MARIVQTQAPHRPSANALAARRGPIAFEPATYEKRPKLSSLMTKRTELQESF